MAEYHRNYFQIQCPGSITDSQECPSKGAHEGLLMGNQILSIKVRTPFMGKMGTMWNMNKTSHTIQKQKGE